MPARLRLRLYENYRFVLYAPFYAAHAIGAYAQEGLDVELLPSPGPGRAEAALAAGEVDVVWMGPIRLMKHHDDNPGSPLVAFAEVVCRDPFSLVGARSNPGFRLAELAGLRFASTAEVPTPWLCLEEDLRQAGVDPARLDRADPLRNAAAGVGCPGPQCAGRAARAQCAGGAARAERAPHPERPASERFDGRADPLIVGLPIPHGRR